MSTSCIPFTADAAINNTDLIPCPQVNCEGRKLGTICIWRHQ